MLRVLCCNVVLSCVGECCVESVYIVTYVMFTRVCYQGVTLQGECDKLSCYKFVGDKCCVTRVYVINVVLHMCM